MGNRAPKGPRVRQGKPPPPAPSVYDEDLTIPVTKEERALLKAVVRAATINPAFCEEFLKTAAEFAGTDKVRRTILTAVLKEQAKNGKMTRGRAPVPKQFCIQLAIEYARRRKLGGTPDDIRKKMSTKYKKFSAAQIRKLIERGNQLHEFYRIDIESLHPDVLAWDLWTPIMR